MVYFYQSLFHSRILRVLIQTLDQTLNTLPQVLVVLEGRGGGRSTVSQIPPKEQRELQLKTGVVAKDKRMTNLLSRLHVSAWATSAEAL